MILGRPARPSRITIAHVDHGRAEEAARVLRPAGHRVQIVAASPRLAQAIVESGPDLLIGSAALSNPHLGVVVRAVRRALGEIPVLVLQGEQLPEHLIEADAMVRDPWLPGELDLLVGGLLRGRFEKATLQQRVRELQGLYKIAWAFSLEAAPEELYGEVSRQCAQLLGAEKGLVLIIDRIGRQIVAQSRAYGLTREQVGKVHYPVDPERTRWDFRANGPLFSNEPLRDARLVPDVVAALEVKSLAIAPMLRGPRVLGLLLVGDRIGFAPFGDADLDLLQEAANEAAVAVENTRLHEELKKANTLLQEYDRLKSEFVAIVAHDFRRPLMAIRGFAELVLEEPELPLDTRQEYMKTVMAETDGLARLADDTLLVTRMETGELEFRFEEIDLGPFLLDTVPMGLSDHSLLLDVPAKLPKIVADRDRLRQVVTNLLSNALKYSPLGSAVTIRCRERGSDHITVEVADKGLGIPKDQAGRLFQKFQRVRTKEHLAVSGTGLGLYICRLIAEGHGGRIWVDSEPGQGSTFGLLLPVDARATGAWHASSGAEGEPAKQA